MELGEKLRSARLEAGLTQKQLCQDIVTRNMLSQIENGNAKPSMNTLREFACRLGKSVSYFLEDTAVMSPNTEVMEEARSFFDGGEFAKAAGVLEQYRGPDAVYDREKQLLEQICLLNLARQAIRLGREPYARQLLERCSGQSIYCGQALQRCRLLLLGRLPGEQVSDRLPSLDEELRIRAKEALAAGKRERAAALLDACEEQSLPQWQLLRGKIRLEDKDYAGSSQNLLNAQAQYPVETAALLEICFRELGDYKRAYEYACKQKK